MHDFSEIIEESIELELNAASLYLIFHFALPEDAAFWWQLHKEERNHASLLSSLKETFLPADLYPDGFVLPSLDLLRSANAKLTDLIEQYRADPPERRVACELALQVEHLAGEIHFQQFAAKQPESKLEEAFHNLIGSDKDHIQKILNYMRENGIETEEL